MKLESASALYKRHPSELTHEQMVDALALYKIRREEAAQSENPALSWLLLSIT